LAVKDVVAGELLLGFGEWAIGGEQLAVLHANRGGGVSRSEGLRSLKDALARGLFHHSPMRVLHALPFFCRSPSCLGVDPQHVSHRVLLNDVFRIIIRSLLLLPYPVLVGSRYESAYQGRDLKPSRCDLVLGIEE